MVFVSDTVENSNYFIIFVGFCAWFYPFTVFVSDTMENSNYFIIPRVFMLGFTLSLFEVCCMNCLSLFFPKQKTQNLVSMLWETVGIETISDKCRISEIFTSSTVHIILILREKKDKIESIQTKRQRMIRIL